MMIFSRELKEQKFVEGLRLIGIAKMKGKEQQQILLKTQLKSILKTFSSNQKWI